MTSATARSSTRTEGKSSSSQTSIRCWRVKGFARFSAAVMISSTEAQCLRSCISPASIRASSIKPSMKRSSRSDSSSITSSISLRPCAPRSMDFSSSFFVLNSSNKVVTDALMDVSGVRKSWVTASSNADLRRSLCLRALA